MTNEFLTAEYGIGAKQVSELSDFVEAYAERSDITVQLLFTYGYRPFPCDCGEDDCQGFQMLQGDAKATYELALMLGKPALLLTPEELKIAHNMANIERIRYDLNANEAEL